MLTQSASSISFGHPSSCFTTYTSHSTHLTKAIRICQMAFYLSREHLWRMWTIVTIFLLFHNLFLLVFSRRIHVFFGMCRYDYVSSLLLVHPFHSHMFILWFPHAVLPLLLEGDIPYLCLIVILDLISTDRHSCAYYVVPLTHLYFVSLHLFCAI